MRRYPLITTLLMLSILGAFQVPSAGGAVPPDLTLSNSLNSNYAVQHSLVGPNLDFYRNSDCKDPYCGGVGSVDVRAPRHYVPGAAGSTPVGVGIGGGPYCCTQRVHLLILRDPSSVLNTEQGRITLWYRQVTDPVAFEHGVYRIFGGPYGHGENIAIYADDIGGGRLHFDMANFDPASRTEARKLGTNRPGVNISQYNGQWIFLKAVWNRNGIDATGETMQLWVAGRKVAASSDDGWSSGQMDRSVDIGSGNDFGIAGKFFIDNLKLYSTSG